jgi:hypothetical protein
LPSSVALVKSGSFSSSVSQARAASSRSMVSDNTIRPSSRRVARYRWVRMSYSTVAVTVEVASVRSTQSAVLRLSSMS